MRKLLTAVTPMKKFEATVIVCSNRVGTTVVATETRCNKRKMKCGPTLGVVSYMHYRNIAQRYARAT